MERVYMVPEKDYSTRFQHPESSKKSPSSFQHVEKMPPVNPVQLSLPSSLSPITSLQEAIQQLNAQPHLNDEARWRAYEELFKTYFAFNRGRPSYSTWTKLSTLSADPDLGGAGGQEWMNRLKPLFADASDIERLVPPIIQTLPVTLRQKGLQLLFFLANTSDAQNGTYQVSQTGHIILSGQEMPGSNLHDLIHYTVRPKRNVPEPQGWSHFLAYLNQHNIPRELLAKHWRERGKARLSIMPKDAQGRALGRAQGQRQAQKRKSQHSPSLSMIQVKRSKTADTDSEEEEFEDVEEDLPSSSTTMDSTTPTLSPTRPQRMQTRALTKGLVPPSRVQQQKGKGGYKRRFPRRRWTVFQ
jgi:hypothetical protein